MNMDVSGFIDRLTACCKEQGLTRTSWAKKFGISESTIRNWIRRGTLPSADIMYNIAKYFNVPIEYLISGEESTLDDIDFIMLLKFQKLDSEKKKIALSIIDSLNSN